MGQVGGWGGGLGIGPGLITGIMNNSICPSWQVLMVLFVLWGQLYCWVGDTGSQGLSPHCGAAVFVGELCGFRVDCLAGAEH